MGLLLILPILVSGYIYCNSSFYRQATINKYEGQLLYLMVAKLGLFVFIAAAMVSFALVYLSKHAYFGGYSLDYLKYIKAYLVRNGIASPEEAPLWVFFGQGSLIAFGLARVTANIDVWGIRLRHKLTEEQAKAFILYEFVPAPPLTKMLLASMRDAESQYMFSMDDRKVYVGRVSSVGEPHETGGIDEDFELVPIMSGYRNKDTLKVAYTTDYSAVVDEMSLNRQDFGFTIVLSQKNIVSMSRFKSEVWERFKAQQPANNIAG